jgi:FtsH-binding integral membrane protein
MNNNFQNRVIRSAADARASLDMGLRTYLLRVYNYMALGLGLTGAVAFMVSTSPALLQAIYTTPLQWLVMLAPLGFVMFISFRIHAIRSSTAQLLFWVYSGLMGLSLSWIFLAYTGMSIAKVFFITSGTFAAMSLYGYTTKADLSRFGSYLIMALLGLILASLVNIFLKSSGFDFVISAIGVLIFVGLTAYDTQNIKNSYYEFDDAEIAGKKAIIGALTLYLDFINLFLHLLRFLGDRR